MAQKRIAVIGAGLSGLANAAMLAKSGFEVTVIEKHSIPGGVARGIKSNGFHFDLGPSWYLMPDIFEKYFAWFGKKPADFYNLIELDPSYKIYFENDRTVSIGTDMEKNFKLFDTLEKNGREHLAAYLEKSEFKYNVSVNEFLYRDYFSFFDFLRPQLIKYGVRLDLLKGLDRHVRKYLKDHRSRKIAEFNTVFLGSSPYTVPALYSLMSYVDIGLGVHYPMGGIYEVPKALHKLGEDEGVKYVFSTNAEKILIEKGKAVGVRTDRGEIPADIVLSAADYHFTDTELLDRRHRNYSGSYWNTRVMGPSALLLYLGLDREFPGIEHHTFYLAHRWKEHFDTIFDNKRWPDNPCYYICCPSKIDPAAAPKGKDLLFVLVPVAPGLDDNDMVRERFTEQIIAHIEKTFGFPLRSAIETQHVVSHRDFIRDGNLYQGTALGLAHTLLQTAFLRPSHKSKRVKNLYFAGHYTQPGVGMPMVLIGAHLINDLITKRHGT